MNIRDLDDSKTIRELSEELQALKTRVSRLEIMDTKLVTERIDTLHDTIRKFRQAIKHIWLEVERITGEQIRMPESDSKPRSLQEAQVSKMETMVADAQREIARKDGERQDEMR